MVDYAQYSNRTIGHVMKTKSNTSRTIHLKGIGDIDRGMAALILRLNQHGFATCECCSGLWHEHREKLARAADGYNPFMMSYISFAKIELSQRDQRRLIAVARKAGMEVQPHYDEDAIVVVAETAHVALILWPFLLDAMEIAFGKGPFRTSEILRKYVRNTARRLILRSKNPGWDESIRKKWDHFESLLLGNAKL